VHPPAGAAFLSRVRAFVPLAEAAGVPGAVLVAQAVLESGWGRSGLARLGNAWFGIKAAPGWPGPVYSGTTREWAAGRGYAAIPGTHRVYPSRAEALAAGCAPGSLFRAYRTPAGNVGDYLRFFHQNPRYHGALRAYAASRDPRRFAVEIAAAGYATAPGYAARLVEVMARVAPDLLRPGAAPSRGISVWLNGVPLPAEALLVREQRVYARLRALAQALGWRIGYAPRLKMVRITTPQEGSR